MGVTIHFEGRLRDLPSFAAVLSLARGFSDAHHWPCWPIEQTHVTLKRVRNEEDWDYSGPVNGLAIEPHTDSEPFRLEFDRDLYLQEYCKTQFAPIEVHLQVVELLNLLKPLFENLQVTDEGEYFETGDLALLTQHRNSCFEVIDQYLAEPDRYQGPTRLQSGRIIDITSRA